MIILITSVCPQEGTQPRVTLQMGGDEEDPAVVTVSM